MSIFAASVNDMSLCTFRSKNVCSGYPGRKPAWGKALSILLRFKSHLRVAFYFSNILWHTIAMFGGFLDYHQQRRIVRITGLMFDISPYGFESSCNSTINLSSVFNCRLPSIASLASISAPRSSAVRSLFVAAILLCVFLFFQFLEYLFRYILQQVLLDIVLRRQPLVCIIHKLHKMGIFVLTSLICSCILSVEVHNLVTKNPFSDVLVGGASIISQLWTLINHNI